MSIFGVMLGVMVLLIVQSVMNGFIHEICQKLVAISGHIRIESDRIIYNEQEIVDRALALSEVDAVAPYAHGVVLMEYENRPAFPFIQSIDLERSQQVVPIEDFMVAGNLQDLDDESILVGAQLAAVLGIQVGSLVEVYTPLMMDSVKNQEMLLPRELLVVGLFEAGWNQVDSQTVVVSLRLMQELYGLGRGVHGVSLRLKTEKKGTVEKVARKLNQGLPPSVRATTWVDSNKDMLFVLRLEKTMMFFIILFIILVASFSISSSLFTAVVRKTREIGLLGALGGKPWEAGLLYCFQGFIVGVSGSALGVFGALLALHFRSNIVDFFASVTHSQDTLLHFYQFAQLPVHYMWLDFVLIVSFATGLSTLAGVFAAWRAIRLKPSEAMRNE